MMSGSDISLPEHSNNKTNLNETFQQKPDLDWLNNFPQLEESNEVEFDT